MYFIVCSVVVTITSIINGGVSLPASHGESLELVHVIFRHGNRTADPFELYPKDPYRNKTYFPFGIGQLTNTGKRREYSIGKALRQRYNTFLGEYYYPEILDSWSTDVNRTKASLLLVLAGLFPPQKVEIWNEFLAWLPVPYNYLPAGKDPILNGIKCPNYLKLYDVYLRTPKLEAEYAKYRGLFSYIAKNTGLNVTVIEHVYDLFFGLATEDEWGLKLPEWTKPVWPKKITDISIQQYYVYTGTTALRKIAVGYFLQRIINETINKISNPKSTRKINLFSAHEFNLGNLLVVLDIFDPHIPTYGSYITFEVHKINNVHGIKIFYQNYTTESPRLMKLPGCNEFCPFSQFISMFEEYLPEPNDCGI